MKLLSTVALFALTLVFIGGTLPASAHARLARAEPAPGATILRAPSEVRIWTTQELTLSGNAVVVTDAAGARVDNGDARVDQSDPNRKQLVVSLSPLASGTYTVSFTTSSAEDGDKFSDSFWFLVELAAQPPAVMPAGVENADGE